VIFDFGWGSNAQVFGVDVFGDHHDKWWHRAFIMPIYRVGRRIRDAVWWVRYRVDPGHKYHLINTRLEPGYYDIDVLMLHGMFSLLRRYVEEEHDGVEDLEKWGRELLGETCEFAVSTSIAQGNKELEAVALYRWWMTDRPAMEKRIAELLLLLYGENRQISFTDTGDGVHQMHMSPFEGAKWR